MSFRSGLRRDRGRVECRAAVLSPTVALRGMNNLTNFSSPEAALSRFILERINTVKHSVCSPRLTGMGLIYIFLMSHSQPARWGSGIFRKARKAGDPARAETSAVHLTQ